MMSFSTRLSGTLPTVSLLVLTAVCSFGCVRGRVLLDKSEELRIKLD